MKRVPSPAWTWTWCGNNKADFYLSYNDSAPQSELLGGEMATTTERLMFLLIGILCWQSFTNEAEEKKIFSYKKGIIVSKAKSNYFKLILIGN